MCKSAMLNPNMTVVILIDGKRSVWNMFDSIFDIESVSVS